MGDFLGVPTVRSLTRCPWNKEEAARRLAFGQQLECLSPVLKPAVCAEAAVWANAWSAFARSQAGQQANTSPFCLPGTRKNDFCHQHSPYHGLIAQFSMINGFHLGEAENENSRGTSQPGWGCLRLQLVCKGKGGAAGACWPCPSPSLPGKTGEALSGEEAHGS